MAIYLYTTIHAKCYSNLIDLIGLLNEIKYDDPNIIKSETKAINRFNNNIDIQLNSIGTESI